MSTWREVAEQLAERLKHHDTCPAGYSPHTGEPDVLRFGPVHHNAFDWKDECPFCADRWAYGVYLAKSKHERAIAEKKLRRSGRGL